MIFWPCSIIYGLVPGQEIYIWLYWPSTRLVNHYMVYQAIYNTVIFADVPAVQHCLLVRLRSLGSTVCGLPVPPPSPSTSDYH
jgi:hypothetical protein